MQKKCLKFHKQRNHQMHTTNNVPQSRCRAFLIYGEPCKMGRWSKRRWRLAEGLFSLLTSQTREACECVPQHTQTHSHMTLKDTITCTNARYVPPNILWRASHFCYPFCDRRINTHTVILWNTLPPCNPQQNSD